MDVSPSVGGIVQVDQTASSPYPATYDFKNGTYVSLEALPSSGYLFNNWSGDLSGNTNPATIAIDCDKSIAANFSQIMTTQVNWPSVGRIIGGLVLVGLLVIVLITRRRAC